MSGFDVFFDNIFKKNKKEAQRNFEIFKKIYCEIKENPYGVYEPTELVIVKFTKCPMYKYIDEISISIMCDRNQDIIQYKIIDFLCNEEK